MSTAVPIFLTTFNCGKRVSDIFDSNSDQHRNFVDNLFKILPKEIPVFFGFGFQELCSIIDGSFPAIVEKCFLDPITKILIDTLKYKYGNDKYFELIGSVSSGAIGMILIDCNSKNTKWEFNEICIAKSGKGMLFSSLKGSCGIRFAIKDNLDGKSTQFTIACCHLTANEGIWNWRRRNIDMIQLMRSLRFQDGFGILKPESHCFILGDLNYRANLNIFQEDDFSDEEINDDLLESIDELSISRIIKNEVFTGFNEAPIKFRPTYKFHEGTLGDYNLKRIPSWCDRILYLEYKHETKVLVYDSISKITLSDHKPVYLSIQIPFQAPVNQLISPDGTLLTTIGTFSRGDLFIPNILDGFIDSVITSSVDFLIGWSLYFSTNSDGRKFFFILMFLCGILASFYL